MAVLAGSVSVWHGMRGWMHGAWTHGCELWAGPSAGRWG